MTRTQELATKIAEIAGDTTDVHDLIEQLVTAAQADRVEDMKIDLADFGQTEAVEIIKANY